MSLDDRLGWLVLGMAIGFVFGYIVRSLREIKEELDEVDAKISESKRKRGEDGFMRYPYVADIAYLLVVAVVAWAAFASQKASNDVKNTQDQLATVTHCNQVYLGAFLEAVDERTSAGQKAVQSNVDLQRSWYEFVRFQLHMPPYPEGEQRDKANEYAKNLKSFLDVSDQSREKVVQNPYPTEDELRKCIQEGNQDE